MSTKGTIFLVGDWHLYEEVFEQWNIYIDLPKDALTAIDGNDVTICIPIAVWKALRAHTTYTEKYIDMPPEALRAEAEAWATQRLERWRNAETDSLKAIVAMGGCFIATITDPFEKQVQDYISYYTLTREGESTPTGVKPPNQE